MAPIKTNKATDEAGFKRLVELEAEYRTQRSAEQLHAIASFPRLFDDFPYPVLISAAILKLADYYRQSNNIQRHAILQVFKKSQPHLKSISNVDETIKRITPVLKSNDQLARAITLRVFGCMAAIAYDRVDVYHNVIHSLDSSEAMEVSAAIYAADRMCAHSQKFCAIISGKLAFMVRDSKTPLPLKRRLIRIFGHMFEDIALARLARKTCIDILDMNQDGEYTVAILRTLTRLASHSLVDVNQQISLLLEMAESHPLQGIRRVSLMCLGSLAQKQIDFSPEQIKTIFSIATTSTDEKSTLRATSTLHKIFRFTSVMPMIYTRLETGRAIMIEFVGLAMELLNKYTELAQVSTTATPVSATVQLVLLECYSLFSIVLPNFLELELDLAEETGAQLQNSETYTEAVQVTIQSMEQFLDRIWSASRTTTEANGQARTVLWLLIDVTLEENTRVETLLVTLLKWFANFPEQSLLLSKALLQLAQQRPSQMLVQQEALMAILEDLAESSKTILFITVFRTVLESLVLHRAKMDVTASEAFESRVASLFEKFSQVDISELPSRNHWELYQLARYSFQAGWPTLATIALKNLERPVLNVPYSLWLSSLQTLALAESSLQSMVGGREETEEGVDLYLQQQMFAKIVASLEEIEAYQIDRTFQLKVCSLRRDYLEACQLTVTTLSLLSTSLSTHRRSLRQNQQDRSADGSSSPQGHASIRLSNVSLSGDGMALYQCANGLNQLAHEYTVLRTFVSSNPENSEETTRLTNQRLQSDVAIEVQQTLCLILAFAIQRIAKSLARLSPSKKTLKGNDNDTEMMEPSEQRGSSSTSAVIVEEDDVFDIDPLLIPLLGQLDPGMLMNGSTASSRMDTEERTTNKSSRSNVTFVDVFKSSSGLTLQYLNEQLQRRTENEDEALTLLERNISLVQQLLQRYISFPTWIPQEFFVSSRPTSHPSSVVVKANQFGFTI
ncbi:Integrator complex subunit 7 [Gryganskiella cystojenkinii]|nr:Integrator complex subunit 7 [Gryganskiella cystojenkinii]